MMKKSKMQIGIALSLMCIILTTAIGIQLNTIDEATKIVGSLYAEAQLKDEVLTWKENYERAYRELEEKEEMLSKTREESTKENSRLSELRKEIDELNRLLGLTEITGSGVVLTLKDNDLLTTKELGANISTALIHDEDLRQIINEFKNTGAEAISINGQRIVSTTAITCSGAVVTVNGVKLNSPFEIKVIGNEAALYGINRIGGYLSILEDEGIIANLEKSSNIRIPKYSGINNPKYMKNVE